MTSFTPGSLLPSGGSTSVPTLPDGTPDFGRVASGGSGNSDPSGMLNIWNIPSEISGQEIWYDNGHRNQPPAYLNSGRTLSITGVGAEHSPDIAPGAIKPRAGNLTGVNAYQILRNPVQIMKQFAALSYNDPAGFMAIQKALASGPWGTVHLNGAWDSSTEKALGNAMLQYAKLSGGAGVGVNFKDYLLETGARAQALGGDGTSLGSGNGAANQVQLTDPESIRAAAQSAAQAALGRGLSEAQLSKFVSQFQSQQTSAETSTGTVTAPDLSAEAMSFAQKGNEGEYKDNQRTSFLDALVNMFAPSASQRPNQAPVPSA